MLTLVVNKTILGIDSLWFLTGAAFLVGLALLIICQLKLKGNEIVQHVTRDIAIAFLVAGLITVIYEHVVDLRRMSDAISIIVGENVPPPVLNAVTSQVFKKEVIRENLDLRWTVEPSDSLPNHQALIKVRISYDLYGLKSHSFDFSVKQELENLNIQDAGKSLPRFDSVAVGDKTYKGEELKRMINEDGLLTLPFVTLHPWAGLDADLRSATGPGVKFIFERTEIINIPGSYNTVLSQITKGVKLEIEHPEDYMGHRLKEWFDRGGQPFKPTGDRHYSFDGIVLPGQSISVQFFAKKPLDAQAFSPSGRRPK